MPQTSPASPSSPKPRPPVPRPWLAPKGGVSHVEGEREPPLWNLTIPQVLARAVAEGGEREAVVFRQPGIRWTWAQFGERVEALATGFIGLGLKPGDRIGIWGPNMPEWLLTQFASARAGLILVCINPAYRLAELDYALNKVGCRALVTAERFKTSDYLGMLRELAPELEQSEPGRLEAKRLPRLEMVIATGSESHDGMLRFDEVARGDGAAAKPALDAIAAAARPDDAINIQFTSGTTGIPKGATLTHSNIINNGRFVLAPDELHAGRTGSAIPVPLYHCFGMVDGQPGLRHAWRDDGVSRRGFDPLATLRGATGRSAARRSTACRPCSSAQLDHPEFAPLRPVRPAHRHHGGLALPVELMKRVVDIMGMREVTIAYGMTETSPVSSRATATIHWSAA